MVKPADVELLANTLRNPGRFVVSPGNVSGPFPYGGTALGFVSEVEMPWTCRYEDVFDPASGVYVETIRLSPEVPSLSFVIDGPNWDTDILTAVFTKGSAGAVLSPLDQRLEGTVDVETVSKPWLPILFAPLDPQHKGVYFRRPVPRLSLHKSVQLAQRLKAGLPILFRPTPDSAWASTPYWQISRVENMLL